MADGRIQDVMRALTIALVLAALPVAAEEKKKSADPAAPATTAAAAAPAAQQQPDSPLVAAAKRANRLGKKPAKVITNESLKTSGQNAHITTTATQAPLVMPKPLDPPRPTPEMEAARAQQAQKQKQAEEAEKQRKAKEAQERKAQADAAAREDGYDGMQDDASELPGTNPPPPQF